MMRMVNRSWVARGRREQKMSGVELDVSIALPLESEQKGIMKIREENSANQI